MSLLIALFSVFVFIVLIFSSVSVFVYGKPISDEVVLEWVEKIEKQGKWRANMYDSSIINGEIGNWKTDNYFTHPPLPILFKYYIEDVGLVWRGSKAAKALDQVREELGAGAKKRSWQKVDESVPKQSAEDLLAFNALTDALDGLVNDGLVDAYTLTRALAKSELRQSQAETKD
jgi:hypothetical protein